ncbi:MAG: sulfotransferase [Chthoniobacteraceae bacterium]
MNQLDIPQSVFNEKTLLFVVGLTRSGTSLLYALLNQHPQIALMYEANALYPGLQNLSLHNLQRLEIWNQAISRHGLKSIDLAQVRDARSLYLTYAKEKDDYRIYGEKSPIYPAYLTELHKKTPDARYLFLLRDFSEVYRSVLSASLHTPWFGKRGGFYRLMREQEKLVRDMQVLKARGVPVHCVHYEDIVQNTPETLRGVCDFLGLEFTPQMATLHGSDLSAISEQPEHDHLRSREISKRTRQITEIPPEREECIERFQQRWDRMLSGNPQRQPSEASWGEYAYYQSVGAAFISYYLAIRWLYELLPVKWIRNYRALKAYLQEPGREEVGIWRAMETIALTISMLLAITAFDWWTGIGVTMAPFYLLPISVAAFRLGLKPSAAVCLAGALMRASVVFIRGKVEFSAMIYTWDVAMHFMQFLIFTFLIHICSRVLSGLVEKNETFPQ